MVFQLSKERAMRRADERVAARKRELQFEGLAKMLNADAQGPINDLALDAFNKSCDVLIALIECKNTGADTLHLIAEEIPPLMAKFLEIKT